MDETTATAIHAELRETNKLLGKLVKYEKARRRDERGLSRTAEAAVTALAGIPETTFDLKTSDWGRNTDGSFYVVENGEHREPTPRETALLATTVSGRGDRRNGRRNA